MITSQTHNHNNNNNNNNNNQRAEAWWRYSFTMTTNAPCGTNEGFGLYSGCARAAYEDAGGPYRETGHAAALAAASRPDAGEEAEYRVRVCIREREADNFCADCGVQAPSFLCFTLGTIVCTDCANVHRAQKRKITDMYCGNLTFEDASRFEKVGNDKCNRKFLYKWNPDEFPQPNPKDKDALKQFIWLKYEGSWAKKKSDRESEPPRSHAAPPDHPGYGADPYGYASYDVPPPGYHDPYYYESAPYVGARGGAYGAPPPAHPPAYSERGYDPYGPPPGMHPQAYAPAQAPPRAGARSAAGPPPGPPENSRYSGPPPGASYAGPVDPVLSQLQYDYSRSSSQPRDARKKSSSSKKASSKGKKKKDDSSGEDSEEDRTSRKKSSKHKTRRDSESESGESSEEEDRRGKSSSHKKQSKKVSSSKKTASRYSDDSDASESSADGKKSKKKKASASSKSKGSSSKSSKVPSVFESIQQADHAAGVPTSAMVPNGPAVGTLIPGMPAPSMYGGYPAMQGQPDMITGFQNMRMY
ncbi:putative ADP-ribosylation factor GTPase-activating protein AGD14 [Porphyridium purpureum]|uniref:Putative ADP-ribosylation factor GTPase-activating protein AGD14 n=1 Tax=Porphyridium purpureum TaxID=35688 RepID=A0A5J4YW43_PORPP|nr:putative ADP-ribosylation factor GTPase-activating protein AGD14 [Porphyridium purpureum]|eukprot:POR0332..scf209_3